MVSAQCAPHCYNKLKQAAISSEHLLPIYWATAVVLGCFNTLILIFSLAQYRHHPKTGVCILQPDTRLCKIIRSTDMYTDLMAAVVAKIVLLPLALMVEFIIAARIFKDIYQCPHPSSNRKFILLFLPMLITQNSIQNYPDFCPVAPDGKPSAGCHECHSPQYCCYCRPRIHHSFTSNGAIYCPLFHNLSGPPAEACHHQQ